MEASATLTFVRHPYLRPPPLPCQQIHAKKKALAFVANWEHQVKRAKILMKQAQHRQQVHLTSMYERNRMQLETKLCCLPELYSLKENTCAQQMTCFNITIVDDSESDNIRARDVGCKLDCEVTRFVVSGKRELTGQKFCSNRAKIMPSGTPSSNGITEEIKTLFFHFGEAAGVQDASVSESYVVINEVEKVCNRTDVHAYKCDDVGMNWFQVCAVTAGIGYDIWGIVTSTMGSVVG